MRKYHKTPRVRLFSLVRGFVDDFFPNIEVRHARDRAQETDISAAVTALLSQLEDGAFFQRPRQQSVRDH